MGCSPAARGDRPLPYHEMRSRMRPTSTSVHDLNADRPLTPARKAAYFALNWINNQLPYAFLDPHLSVRDFVCPTLERDWADLPKRSSPSRTLSDLFWLTLPWAAI